DESPTKYVDAINKIKKTEEPEGKKQKAKKAHAIPILSGIAAALLLIALIVVFIALYANGYFPGSKVPDVQVPNLVGKKYVDVQADTSYKNFTIKQGNTEYSDKYDEGQIISQDPAANETVKKGSTITVTVSKGSQKGTVPDVADSDQSTAQVTLQNQGFTNTKISKIYDDTTAVGYVIKTDPEANSNVSLSATITLYVSMGPDPGALISVPDLTGLTYSQAKSRLEQNNLKIGTETSQYSSSASGTVISQSPTNGTQVSKNTVVNVVVSKGQKPATATVTLQDYYGDDASTVRKNLINLGLNVTIKQVKSTVAAGLVISQNPVGGSTVNVGTTVTLYVSYNDQSSGTGGNQ
ncbi:MAG TPA: PASTA domain-containing protein, partial [Clostridia bacterium]|nr:PASTA domain-containing protein [Clostridia bacterium]